MQRGVLIYIAGTLVLVGAVVAAGIPLMNNPKTQGMGGGLLFLSALIPMVMAWVAHRLSGGAGSPFKGLAWGPTPYYFLVWLGGIGVGLLAGALSLGLGLATFDTSISDYVDMAVTQAESQGTTIPDEAEGGIKIAGYVTAVAGPTLLPWFLAIFICLGTFPWLGFLYRRLMVNGKAQAVLILMVLWLVLGTSGGLVQNPMAADLGLPVRMLLNGLLGMAMGPAMVWLFLRTGSAVIPALAQGSYQGMISTWTVLFSDINVPLGVPMGAIAILCPLLAGIALWIWKDPGGEQLAVAAVAGDGTPLTPEQQRAMSDPLPSAPHAGAGDTAPVEERETTAAL